MRDIYAGVKFRTVFRELQKTTSPHPQAKTLNVPSHPILAKDRVCYVGQPVAIVLAESRYLAQDALELVHVD